MYFRRKTSAGRAYLQIVESRRTGEQVPLLPWAGLSSSLNGPSTSGLGPIGTLHKTRRDRRSS